MQITYISKEYKVTTTGKRYNGVVHKDHYGRPVPKHAHGTGNLENWTSSTAAIAECMMQLYDRIIDPDLMVRRINICACNSIEELESVRKAKAAKRGGFKKKLRLKGVIDNGSEES